jgi:Ca-activated chloride channel family protein
VPDEPDYYALLGVPRNASTEQLRRAYRESALRLHPDRANRPGDTELFISVNKAYEILSNEEQRAAYDERLAASEADLASRSCFRCEIQQSRRTLLQLDEPQVHYLLIDITPSDTMPEHRPPINLSIVIDRSTSMRGQRLDQVRSAALTILKDMAPQDSASVIAFSDRAEVIVSPDQAKDTATARARLSLLQAGGGTEIGQGLQIGMEELQRNLSREGVSHLVMLTDGRTYGDEDLCLSLADRASELGITINGVGIGADWSDRLLDDLASRSGGNVIFLDTPKVITGLLQRIFDGLSQVVASRVRLDGSLAQQVDLRSAFRLMPDPMPLGDSLPLVLGNLTRQGRIRVLLELVIHPIGQVDELALAHFTISGDILAQSLGAGTLPADVHIASSKQPEAEPPPTDLVAALNVVGLYRMQEKARHEAELGQSSQAARRLENLATHLLAAGDRELAKAALSEAERLTHTRRLSIEGEKVLKYGTRALLLLPAKAGGE